MPKANSPIRLQEELMREAELSGKLTHRSTAEQIEYWASIGLRVSKILDPETLLSVASGLAQVKVVTIHTQPVNPDTVFANLESRRQQNALSQEVTQAETRYQSSTSHPGYLEMVDANDKVIVGQFKEGHFVPLMKNTSETSA